MMRRLLTVSALGCILILSSACAPKPQPVVISAKPVAKPELVLPKADRLTARDVTWVVITPDNYEKVFSDLAKKGQPVVLFALTDKGYENLSLNLSDVRAYIQQQKAIILAYEAYYKDGEAALKSADQQIQSTVDLANRQNNN